MKIIGTVFRLGAIVGLGVGAWKLVRHWQKGQAEKAGHVIDASVSAAAKKFEEAASTVEKWAEGGLGENLGKGLDDIVIETKKTLENATVVVQSALSHAH
jgi:hypothetical protein